MAQTRNNNYGGVLAQISALEAELADAATGIGLPADPQLTQLVTHSIVNRYPLADIQIIVSSSRKTTTTKHSYETETPGMVGLDVDKLRELQQQLMQKISLSGFDAKSAVGAVAASQTNGKDERSQRNSEDLLQHKSTVDELLANEDGTRVTSKRLTRVVTTSHSAVSGLDNDYSNGKAADGAQPSLQYLNRNEQVSSPLQYAYQTRQSQRESEKSHDDFDAGRHVLIKRVD